MSCRRRRQRLLKTIPSSPVAGLALYKSTDGTEVALVAEKVSLLGTLGPELDRVGQGTHCLMMAANERSAKVDILQLMLFGVEIGDLTDIVTARGMIRLRVRIANRERG